MESKPGCIRSPTRGVWVTVTNYGAKIVSFGAGQGGKMVDVVLGHPTIDDYLSSEEPYFGAVCGAWPTRIAKGRFTLEKRYRLAVNNG